MQIKPIKNHGHQCALILLKNGLALMLHLSVNLFRPVTDDVCLGLKLHVIDFGFIFYSAVCCQLYLSDVIVFEFRAQMCCSVRYPPYSDKKLGLVSWLTKKNLKSGKVFMSFFPIVIVGVALGFLFKVTSA
jgi:hypothetical protein